MPVNMQSSPPERAWKQATSPAGSQYSVDLAALDLDARSGASSPVPAQYVDKIRSSDIDGPSDFTLNMGPWMNGGTMGRGTAKSFKKGLESLRETRDEGVQANRSFLTPRKQQEEEQSASHHTPSNSPPFESVFDARPNFSQGAPDVSEWDPYTDGEESTPGVPAQNHFLQPTVEDYYSELTPARMLSVRRTKSGSSHTHVAGHDEYLEKERPTSPGRPSSETLSPVRSPERSRIRSPALARTAPRHFSSQSTEAAFESQMNDLQAKCKQLEILNAALSHAVEEERRMRADEKSSSERRTVDAARREQALADMKDQAYAQRDEYRKDLTELKMTVAQHDGERADGQQSSDAARKQYDEDVRRMTEDTRREKAAQQTRIRTLEQDLELARRNCDTAEEAERAAREELDKHRAALEKGEQDDLDRMQSDLTQIEDPHERVQELEEDVRAAKTQIDKLRVAKKVAEDETSDIRAELASLRRTQDDAARVTTDHRRAVAVAEDLQGQLQKLREQLHNEQTEIERMRNEVSNAPDQSSVQEPKALQSEVEAKQIELNTAILERDALRDDLEAQQSTLNAAILERDDAQDALTTAQSSLLQAQEALADQEAVAMAIDAKVSAAIAKREAYWRGRLEASEQERQVMVKALLRQWGREEVGVTEGVEDLEGRQGYEYQFVTKKKPLNGGHAKAGA